MMAVLGVQLVLSMVMASVLSKLSPRMSFARWILCSRLVRYLHPTDEELRALAGSSVSGGSGKGKGSRRGEHKKGPNEPFTIPKNLDIQLEAAKVDEKEVLQLHFYTEYQWLVDFALIGMIIYMITELYYAILQPTNEFNLSMMWCLLVIGFALRVLLSVTAIYFRTEDAGERIMCITFGFFFLVVAMAVLIIDEDTLEFGLDLAYVNFSKGAQEFMHTQGIESHGPASLITFKIALAIFGAVLGGFLTFPGLRLAKMHTDALKYVQGRPFMQLLLHLNIVFPIVIVLMWIRPVTRDLLVKADHLGKPTLMDNASFESLRITLILVFCFFRFIMSWTYLQAHLNMACERVATLKKEAGRISSVDLQRMITRVFYYLCVVALQYMAPLILLLYCAFMLKTLGDYSITGPLGTKVFPHKSMTVPVPESNAASLSPDGATEEKEETIGAAAAQFSLALSGLRQVFTPTCFRGVFSFLCWWICQVWFTTSCFGMVYYSYFT